MELESIHWYIENYIPQEGLVLLYGKYGTFKTPITLNMAKAIVLGEELWGLKVTQAEPVLYISADTPPKIITPRLQMLNIGGCEDKLDVSTESYPGLDVVNLAAQTEEAEKVRDLAATHNKKRYKVVFIDSLRAIHKMDDKESGDVRQVYGVLATIFAGAPIVIIHHDRKSSKDETEQMKEESFSGSQALLNHATVGIKVEHRDRRRQRVALIHTKSQAGPLQPELMLAVEDEVATVPVPTQVEIEGAIKKSLDQGLTGRALDKSIAEQLGCSERTARRRRLEKD